MVLAAHGMVVVIFHFLMDECKKSRDKKTGKGSKKTSATWWPGERGQDVEESTLPRYVPSYLPAWCPFGHPHPVKELSHPTSLLALCYYWFGSRDHHHSPWLCHGFLPTLHASNLPFSFILLSEIFKDSTIPWKIKSKFWAWVTTLNDPDPARTCRIRQAIISRAYVLATLNHGPLPMHDISSVLLRFGRWEDVLSFLFQQTPLHPARSNSWVVLLCILMALYSNYPVVLSLFDSYHSSSGFLTCRNYFLVSINPLSWCLGRSCLKGWMNH